VASDNNLWQAIYTAFPYPSDRVQREMNRIAGKCLKKALGWTRPVVLDSSTCDVHQVVIDGAELASLIRYHERTNVTGRITPIVIVRIGDQDILIEGNNRVNKWVKERDLAPRLALVIVPRDERTP
jgi:hypothetical protein